MNRKKASIELPCDAIRNMVAIIYFYAVLFELAGERLKKIYWISSNMAGSVMKKVINKKMTDQFKYSYWRKATARSTGQSIQTMDKETDGSYLVRSGPCITLRIVLRVLQRHKCYSNRFRINNDYKDKTIFESKLLPHSHSNGPRCFMTFLREYSEGKEIRFDTAVHIRL